MSCAPMGSITIADEQYIHRSRVVTRYLFTNFLNHTIYAADTQADTRISRFPSTPDCVCEPMLLDTIIAIAPAIPISRPTIFIFDTRSIPTITERKSTMRGVEVLMIEPSMGDVCASPNIIHSFRATPMSIAAPKIFRRSVGATRSGFSQNIGTSDSNAAMTSDADTIAIGEMYRPSTRL